MKTFAVAIILTVSLNTTGCVFAQQKSVPQQTSGATKSDNPKQLSPELMLLINNARSVPAEFAADALITIVELKKIANPEESRRLLEEAFQDASSAQQPIKRKAVGGSVVDTRSGFLSLAFERRLDTLSLQSRAAKAMLAINKQAARQMFASMPKPKLSPLNCADPLSYDVEDFYSTLGRIADATFNKEEKQSDAHIRFVQSYIEDMHSPAQVEPLANAILIIKPSPAQLTLLVRSFSDALGKVAHDDRNFSASIFGGRNLAQLVATCKRQGVARNDLLRAWRAYLVEHFSGSRCADNLNQNEQVPAAFSQSAYTNKFIDYFNTQLLEVDASNKQLPPITPDEMKASNVDEAAKIYPYWQTAAAKQLLFAIKKLRFGSGTKTLTDAEKATPEWQTRLGEFLNDLANWSGESEKSPEDYFHQKSVLYEGLCQLVPAGAERDNVLSSYIVFLKQSTMQQSSHIEWFLHANGLIKIASSAKGDDHVKLLDALDKDSILKLYADLIRVLPSVKTQSQVSL